MAAGLKTRRPFSLFRDAGKLEPLADFALAYEQQNEKDHAAWAKGLVKG